MLPFAYTVISKLNSMYVWLCKLNRRMIICPPGSEPANCRKEKTGGDHCRKPMTAHYFPFFGNWSPVGCLTVIKYLYMCSGIDGSEAEKALRETVAANRRHIVDDWISARGVAECQHEHRGAQGDGRCSKGSQDCTQKHVCQVMHNIFTVAVCSQSAR